MIHVWQWLAAVLPEGQQAIDCAPRCEAAGERLGLRLHLGIHAARIAAASAPGEVLEEIASTEMAPAGTAP
jgi:hypothetical protein